MKTSVAGKNKVCLLFVLMLWISVILCATRVQGEFEKFPPHLHCHYHNILINVLFSLARDGCEKSCLTESMLGFTLEAKLVSSKHLTSVYLKISSRA